MFSSFTEKARIAINKAHDAACTMGHGYIGSEHLLLGILEEGTGVGAKILETSGVKKEELYISPLCYIVFFFISYQERLCERGSFCPFRQHQGT